MKLVSTPLMAKTSFQISALPSLYIKNSIFSRRFKTIIVEIIVMKSLSLLLTYLFSKNYFDDATLTT